MPCSTIPGRAARLLPATGSLRVGCDETIGSLEFNRRSPRPGIGGVLKAMTIADLYPYWNDSHAEFMEALNAIEDELWGRTPAGREGRTIAEIAFHVIETECFWIGEVAQSGPKNRLDPANYPTKGALIEGIEAARSATILYLDVLKYESLKSVRGIPADPKNNVPETNMPLSWIIWHVMEHEIYHWGQIVRRAEDLQSKAR